MKKADHRDASIDTFLRNSLRSGEASPGSGGSCVDAETVAAWSEGSLSSSEAAAVEAHVAGCASCQQVLAVFARSAPDPGVSGVSRTRWHLRWAIPMTAAAAAAAIWVAIPEEGRRLDDAFSAQQGAATDQNLPPAAPEAVIPPQPQEKSEAPGLERSDAVSPRSATREREEDASAKAEPAAPPVAAPQENRALADTQARSEVTRRAPEAAAPAQMRQAGFAPVEIISPDPAIRWRILSTGQLERSTNAGQTWEPVTLSQKVTAVRALSATAAIATAADGRDFRTDDQGKTWNPVQP